jgi:hypothetical protein
MACDCPLPGGDGSLSDRQRSMRVRELREYIAKGLASARAGRLKDGPSVVAGLQARLDEIGQDRRPR